MPIFETFHAHTVLLAVALILPGCDGESDESPAAESSSTGAPDEGSTGEDDSIPVEVCQTVEAVTDCGNASEACVFDDDNHRVCDPIEGEEAAVQCVLDAIAAGDAAALDSGYFVQEGDSMEVHYVIAADGSGWQESSEVSGGVCNTDKLFAWGATDVSDCSTIECLRIRFEAAQTDVCTDTFAC